MKNSQQKEIVLLKERINILEDIIRGCFLIKDFNYGGRNFKCIAVKNEGIEDPIYSKEILRIIMGG